MDRPFGLLAELTYACPLHCPYCSNPLDMSGYGDELTTPEWLRVLDEARELGVLQRLAEGKVYKQIAHELTLSTSTVRTHLHNI